MLVTIGYHVSDTSKLFPCASVVPQTLMRYYTNYLSLLIEDEADSAEEIFGLPINDVLGLCPLILRLKG